MLDKYSSFVEKFKSLSGLDLSLYKERQMKRRVNTYMKRQNMKSYNDFFAFLKEKDNLKEFMSYLTINVSEFFRNPAQWEVLEEKIIPHIIKHNKKPVIWSAACSTGEEPYTLAMIFNKHLTCESFKIYATDIDENVINFAKQGIYSKKSLKNLPNNYMKYFDKISDDEYKICSSLKQCVNFSKINLLTDEYPNNCDLIVLRNVLIYFTEQAKQKIYKKIYKSLTRWGILFVGNTEQIIMSFKYGLAPLENFFYKKTHIAG